MNNNGGNAEESNHVDSIESKTLAELYELASEVGIKSANKYRKAELITKIKEVKAEQNGLLYGEGILELVTEGFGFLRRKGIPKNPRRPSSSIPSTTAIAGLYPMSA